MMGAFNPAVLSIRQNLSLISKLHCLTIIEIIGVEALKLGKAMPLVILQLYLHAFVMALVRMVVVIFMTEIRQCP